MHEFNKRTVLMSNGIISLNAFGKGRVRVIFSSHLELKLSIYPNKAIKANVITLGFFFLCPVFGISVGVAFLTTVGGTAPANILYLFIFAS